MRDKVIFLFLFIFFFNSTPGLTTVRVDEVLITKLREVVFASGINIGDKLIRAIHKRAGEYVMRAYAKWVNNRFYNTEKSSALDTTNMKFRTLVQIGVSPGVELKKKDQKKEENNFVSHDKASE